MKLKSEEKTYIRLYGTVGKFKVPNSLYEVTYFSTLANNRIKNSGPHQLLKELKPMRERVDASSIKDISSLLQRDLNDARVAQELVPYLLGSDNPNNIAFFPAILAALIPKSFLNEKDGDPIKYPVERPIEGNDSDMLTSFDDNWILETFSSDDGTPTPLAMLKIDPFETDIIVLDGQHRANAFRVISGTFSSAENSVYDAFYDDIEPIDEFTADLPVTIIWFSAPSSTAEIDPKLITRKLFVDVNNTAQAVSESRKILLNDNDPTAVLTRSFYTFIASERSFLGDQTSMLHAAFDIDSNIQDANPHILSLTSPQIVYDFHDWMLFGSRVNNDLSRYEVLKYPSHKTDTSQLAKVLPVTRSAIVLTETESGYDKLLKPDTNQEEIIQEYSDTLIKPLLELFDGHNMVIHHISSSENMEKLREEKWNSKKREAWDKVFCGGEGLYYSFTSQTSKNKAKSNVKLKDQIDAIKEIERDFSADRAEKFKGLESKRVNEAFRSFRTKAFQTGYFMAFFDFLSSNYSPVDSDNIISAAKEFMSRVNKVSANGWVNILTDLRAELINGTDPRKWPAYHKIVLRVIQKDDEYYAQNKDTIKHSPEIRVFKDYLIEKVKGWASSEGIRNENIEFISFESSIESWVLDAKTIVIELFERCEIDLDEEIEWEPIAREYLEEKYAD